MWSATRGNESRGFGGISGRRCNAESKFKLGFRKFDFISTCSCEVRNFLCCKCVLICDLGFMDHQLVLSLLHRFIVESERWFLKSEK
jgi:hypothetical protein